MKLDLIYKETLKATSVTTDVSQRQRGAFVKMKLDVYTKEKGE